MPERSRAVVERGLPNSLWAVTVVESESGTTVGMARVVGDGGSAAMAAAYSTAATWSSIRPTRGRDSGVG